MPIFTVILGRVHDLSSSCRGKAELPRPAVLPPRLTFILLAGNQKEANIVPYHVCHISMDI